MDWIRAREMLSGPTMAPTSKPQAIPPMKHSQNQSQSQLPSEGAKQPQFCLVDAKNRVRELTSNNGHEAAASQTQIQAHAPFTSLHGVGSFNSSSSTSSLSGSTPISIPLHAKTSSSPNGAMEIPSLRRQMDMQLGNDMAMPTMITSNAMRGAQSHVQPNSDTTDTNPNTNRGSSMPVPIGRAIPIAGRQPQRQPSVEDDLETQLKYQQEEMRLFPRPPSNNPFRNGTSSNNNHHNNNGLRSSSQFGLPASSSSSSSLSNANFNTNATATATATATVTSNFHASPNLRSQTIPHAFTFSESTTPLVRTPLRTTTNPLPVPPVSPFANMALSAPTTSMGGFGFGNHGAGSTSATPINRDAPGGGLPRLPSFEMFRAGSPGNAMNMGMGGGNGNGNGNGNTAKLPPPLSLRDRSAPNLSTLSSSFGSMDQPNGSNGMAMYSSSFTSPSPSTHGGLPTFNSIISPGATPLFSQSLPGPNFLRERRASIASITDVVNNNSNLPGTTTTTGDHWMNSSEDEENSIRLGSSVEEHLRTSLATQLTMNSHSSSVHLSSSLSSTPRAGRVCRHANCTNIARSRGLCRTHGGGKRCSHPNCTKSAQANRKCIAHGGGTPCSFADCDKTAQSRGLCKAHGGGARCKYPNCTKSSQSRGLCRGHGGGIKCKEDGCEKWVQKNGYCIKHGRERAASIA